MNTFAVETAEGITIVKAVAAKAAAEVVAGGCDIHFSDEAHIKVYTPVGSDLVHTHSFAYGPTSQADIDRADDQDRRRREAAGNAAISGQL